MIEIKSVELRNKVTKFYEFDAINSELIDNGDGQFTGNFWHETYQDGSTNRTYYFQGSKLVAYEGHFDRE